MKKGFSHTISRKVSIIGCGRVGSATAFSIVTAGIASELVLVGTKESEVHGIQLDLEHALPFLEHPTKISVGSSYQAVKDSDVVVITAGAAQSPGETRLDLAIKNTVLIEDIVSQVVAAAPQAVIIMVSNPVDVLTYKAYVTAGLPKGKIFGTGTALDTARYKFYLSEKFHVSPHSIHAFILGEHGDSSFPATASALVGGQPLESFEGFDELNANESFEKARNAATEIRKLKGFTSYGIAVTTTHLVEQVLSDSRVVLPVSIPLHNYLGESGVALSVPCVIGRNGVERVLDVKLSWEEKQAFAKSAEIVREYC